MKTLYYLTIIILLILTAMELAEACGGYVQIEGDHIKCEGCK